MYPKIETASVKVMRSHDYCHFEVCLSTNDAVTPEAVDNLRKEAARLADKAVEQYKVAKVNAERLTMDDYDRERVRQRAAHAEKVPESERTPGQKAAIKVCGDWAHRNRPRYDYQDQWSEPDYEDEQVEMED